MNVVMWIARTGVGWRDLSADARVGWKTTASRFYRWTASAVWHRILAESQRDAAESGGVDRSRYFVPFDGNSVRAHQHAAGARGGQVGEALCRSRGGFSTKFHVGAEGHGRPLALVLSAG